MITYNGIDYPTRMVGGKLVSTDALLNAMKAEDTDMDEAGVFVKEEEKLLDEQIAYYATEEEFELPELELYKLIYDDEDMPEDPEDFIVVTIEDGVVQGVISSTGKVRVIIVDKDDNADDPIVMFTPQMEKKSLKEVFDYMNETNAAIQEEAARREEFENNNGLGTTEKTTSITRNVEP